MKCEIINKRRLEEVEETSLIPFEEFEQWAENQLNEFPFKNLNKYQKNYTLKHLHIKRFLDRMCVRQSQEPELKGLRIEFSNNAVFYPESQALVRSGYKLWIHDLGIADFACFTFKEIKMMMNCLKKGKWAIEKFEH